MKRRRGQLILLIVIACAVTWFFRRSHQESNPNRLDSQYVRQLQHYDQQVQSEMDAIWHRIEKFLLAVDPNALDHLPPPATDDQIATMENAFGFRLPGDFKASLKRHSGWPRFFSVWDLLTPSDLMTVWRMQADFGVYDPWVLARDDDWMHPGLIPFAGWDSDTLCIHLETGHVLSCDETATTEYEAASFRNWLTTVADRLESGTFSKDELQHGSDLDIVGGRWPDVFSPGSEFPDESKGDPNEL